MNRQVEYKKGAELADCAVTWEDNDGNPLDLSTGYSFSVKVGSIGKPADFTKTSGLTGTSTGLTISWATTGELNDLDRGTYTVQMTATRTADNRQRIRDFRLKIIDSIT